MGSRFAPEGGGSPVTARYLVVQALCRVEEGGYGNLVLDGMLKKSELSGQDKAFASAVFYQVLEHRNTLDYILNQFLKKPVTKLDAPVRAILRSGLAQMRYLRTPASAAVNESVKLTRACKKSSASGMVNAVLRRAGSYDWKDAKFASETERLCVLGSVSPSVAEHFLRWYPDEAEAILTATHLECGTAIRVNTLRTTTEALQKRLLAEGAKQADACPIPDCLLVQFAGSPADVPSFAEGLFHVQGRTSQLAALALEAKPGDKIIDLCAAPGGKSLTIGQQMQDTGSLTSCDVSENRVSLLDKTLHRGGLTCAKAVQNDASVYNPAFAGADRILADVPCSGLGILQKKPDIRYKDVTGLGQLVALQKEILEQAAACLKPGGRLVYSTCTLNPDENEGQIAAFLARHPEFTVQPVHYLPETMPYGAYGAVSVPSRTGMDGFFICAMEKH